MLDKETTFRALQRLAELAREKEIHLSLTIYGGTVMMLAYDCRAATKDIDAIFHPPEVVAALLAQVARELALPEDWMNDGVRPFVATREERIAFAELAIPGLVITRPSPRYLLAMKCLAGRLPTPFRAGDAADIKLLLRRLGLHTIEEVDAIVADYYGARKLEDDKRWLVEKLLRKTRDEKNHPA